MLRPEKFSSCLVLSTLALISIVLAQDPPRKPPALIRDTGVAEGKADPETAKKKELSPLLARQSLEKGDFYLKRGNLTAAIDRYLDAIEYQPNFFEAYDALGRAYEKKGDKGKALAVYQDFLKKNPDSPKAEEFKARCAQLAKKK